jgi:hypothetical protein
MPVSPEPSREPYSGPSRNLASPISPPNKPIDATTNEKDWKACTYDGTWSTPNASLILPLIVVVLTLIVLSQRRNSESQQQDNR